MSPCHILVVDDNADVRESLVMVLELLGHRAISCASGGDALQALRAVGHTAEPFDLAIVDVGMPDMSGYELLAAMRQAGATVPAVALTGYASPSDLERAAQAGFESHLAKPVDMPALRALLQRIELDQASARTVDDPR